MEDEPDIKFGPFSLWVFNRQFPNCDDYWDGNWLAARAEVNASCAWVRAEGPIIHLAEIARFLQELERLQREVKGTAQLKCIEPNLNIAIEADSLGHLEVEVSITPDHLHQKHRFNFSLDQTYVPPVVTACRQLLSRYPIKGSQAG
jgi:hypothetical protein